MGTQSMGCYNHTLKIWENYGMGEGGWLNHNKIGWWGRL